MMIESPMFIAIGFLAACLLLLGFVPLTRARGVRLTDRKHRDVMPASINEMRVEKHHLCAEFAMSTRRLEIALQAAKVKATNQLCEVGKKFAEIHHLKRELSSSQAALLLARSSSAVLPQRNQSRWSRNRMTRSATA